MTYYSTDIELAVALREAVRDPPDPEETHREMDKILVQLLKTLGYPEAMRVYEGQERWYA